MDIPQYQDLGQVEDVHPGIQQQVDKRSGRCIASGRVLAKNHRDFFLSEELRQSPEPNVRIVL